MILNKRFFGGFCEIYLNHRKIETSGLQVKFSGLNSIIFNIYFSIHPILQKQFNKTKK
jgi:hypothetical protein